MEMSREIASREDIQMLVDTFYGKVREDQRIGPIFNRVIEDRWPTHLEKMYRFWETILLGKGSYQGSPFPKHAPLGLVREDFLRWLELWHETLDAHFVGIKAEEAKWRADRMAAVFLSKIEHIRQNPNLSIL